MTGTPSWGGNAVEPDHLAVKAAVELLHIPSRARAMKAEPLPLHTLAILRISAGDEEAIAAAVAALRRPRLEIEEAATFFIEQILLDPGSNSYRVLGALPSASTNELRRNMALLLRWVHPDLDRKAARAALAARVTSAWEDLKTPERRLAFDDQLATLIPDPATLTQSSRGLPSTAQPGVPGKRHRQTPRRLRPQLGGIMSTLLTLLRRL